MTEPKTNPGTPAEPSEPLTPAETPERLTPAEPSEPLTPDRSTGTPDARGLSGTDGRLSAQHGQ